MEIWEEMFRNRLLYLLWNSGKKCLKIDSYIYYGIREEMFRNRLIYLFAATRYKLFFVPAFVLLILRDAFLRITLFAFAC